MKKQTVHEKWRSMKRQRDRESKATFSIEEERSLRIAYAQQLDEIANVLLKGRLLTKGSILRNGVAFAVEKRFGPPPVLAHKKVTRKAAAR